MRLVATYTGVAVEWRPIPANDIAGARRPAIKLMALRIVWEVARALPVLPIIGVGGLASVPDAPEFLVAGASAIQVGTATFADPTASKRLVDELARELDPAGIVAARDLVGTLRSNRGG